MIRARCYPLRGVVLVQLAGLAGLAAVLAGAAIPKYEAARRGAMVARASQSLDRIAMAMEAYALDYMEYPPLTSIPGTPFSSNCVHFRSLSTPVAYASLPPRDPFNPVNPLDGTGNIILVAGTRNGSQSSNSYPHTGWITWSRGPDGSSQVEEPNVYQPFAANIRSLRAILANEALAEPSIGIGNNSNGMRYDPTNGAASIGDIYRHGGDAVSKW